MRFIYLFLIGGKLLYNIVLVSATHQHQSAIGVRIPLPRDFSLYVWRVFYLFIHCHIPMASGSITSWQIDGETEETVADFIFLGSKITADGDCSHEDAYSLEGKL